MTDRLRQKIWGTDQPPGLEDPYGDKSVFDQTKKRQEKQNAEDANVTKKGPHKAKRAKQQNTQKAQKATEFSRRYKPAVTWDGLEEVGGPIRDRRDWEGEYAFSAFAPADVMADGEVITAALHRAMVEVFALQEAGLPLSGIATGPLGQDLTMDVTFGEDARLQFADIAPSLEQIVQSLSPALNETVEKTDPTESEEDVAADRSDVDPLHPEAAEATVVDETAEKSEPTESEEDVAADRSTEDPLQAQPDSIEITYEDLIASWGSAWLQVSIADPEVKFAVSPSFPSPLPLEAEKTSH